MSRFLFLVFALSATAAQGQVVDTLHVTMPDAREVGMLRYWLEPAAGIMATGPVDGKRIWTIAYPPVIFLPLVLPGVPRNRLLMGPPAVTWDGGQRDTMEVWAETTAVDNRLLNPAPSTVPRLTLVPDSAHTGYGNGGQEWVSVPVGGLSKQIDVELYGTTRTASPGGLVVVRYCVNSYEDQDEHVRLRLILPPEWTFQHRDIEEHEFRLESWESVEGEVRVTVPTDVKPGERHNLRMVAEVIGEPGRAEVYTYVQVTRRGGLKPGQAGLTGTASATNVTAREPGTTRYGGVINLSGTVARQTTLSMEYRKGPRETALTNYRIAQEETQWSSTLRGSSWQFQFGNQVTSSGNVITGPSVRGRGVSARSTQGLVIGDLTVVQPTTFTGPAAGHLIRGNVGLNGKATRIALFFSDFGRPVGGYTTTPVYPQVLEPEEVERLERERLATERAPSNRVQGAGLDIELQHTSRHRLTARGGWLRLANAEEETTENPSAEVLYAFSHRRGTLNARWRQMPRSLQGVALPGNEKAVDASLKVISKWQLAGRAYRTLTETRGNMYHAEGEGISVGIRYARGNWRMEVRGNHRAWNYGEQPTVAQTVTFSFGLPVGPLTFSGYADVGHQENGMVLRPTKSFRSDLRWSGRESTVSWSTSYFETMIAPPRLRTDMLGSIKLGPWAVAGGAWATQGLMQGGEPGFWTQVGIPLIHDFLLSLGIERTPIAWGQSPSWLGTVGLQTNVAFALPFLRALE